MKKNAPVLLTVKEVSTLLRIHRPKVYDLIRDGVIDGFKLGSDWRVRRASLEKLTGPIPGDFFSSSREFDENAPGRHTRSSDNRSSGGGQFE